MDADTASQVPEGMEYIIGQLPDISRSWNRAYGMAQPFSIRVMSAGSSSSTENLGAM
jgi:hypothetical protein